MSDTCAKLIIIFFIFMMPYQINIKLGENTNLNGMINNIFIYGIGISSLRI